jgi:hypothetical protein
MEDVSTDTAESKVPTGGNCLDELRGSQGPGIDGRTQGEGNPSPNEQDGWFGPRPFAIKIESQRCKHAIFNGLSNRRKTEAGLEDEL